MHPFGREAETSLHDLFEYFKRCLQHGEWELASACVPQLVHSSLSENLRDIIRAIICRPYRLKWESMGSPHKLAWFWLQVLEKWTEEKVSPNVRKELEFLLLLEELGSEGIMQTLLKDLHQAFLNSQLPTPNQTSAAGGSRSTDAALDTCLRTLLEKKKPRLAQSLAHFVQDHSSTEDHVLQQTFILHLLKKLRKPEKNPEKVEEWVEEIYAVLAVMPWSGSSSSSSSQFEALCEALWMSRDGPLKEEKVLSCLLRPQCHALVSQYCCTALRLQRDLLLRSTPQTQVELSEAEKLSLSLCCHKDRASVWKTIYFECLSSGKHFLEQVLVTALDLIKHEDFPQLRDLLQQEFQPMCRLLLLLGWTQCRSLDSAQQLLSVLHAHQEPANDSVLHEFANLLSSQLVILEWCKNNNPDISMDALLSQLHSLDNHSALYILHSLTLLPQFEERRILELLQQLPLKPGAEETETLRILSPGVQKNIVLFQGFCAMKYAVYALCVNAHKYSNCAECKPTQQQQQHQHQSSEAGADHYQTSASAEGSHLQFQHFLSECQLYLETVPALFRLELLENIFSLLFLSTSDFMQLIQRDVNSNLNTDNSNQDSPSDGMNSNKEPGAKVKSEDGDHSIHEKQKSSPTTPCHTHLDLGHFIQGCTGFLVDITAMEGFLKLLKEGLEGMCVVGQQEDGRTPSREAEVAEGLGCSVTPDTFGARLQRLSKRTAEAQWRLQIITSNHGTDSGPESPLSLSSISSAAASLGRSKTSSLRRRRRGGSRHMERQNSIDKRNGEVSTSASDGGGGVSVMASVELEVCPCGGAHSWLVPAMLSPPESLLMSCIRRGNFMEARQVSLVFDLSSSHYCGELVFMERYKDVLADLGQVEQKMESQPMSSSSSSSEGLGSAAVSSAGRVRLGSSGRSTLQAIGSAAAAGVAFYSISDIADRLLSTPTHPMPSLEEGYWLSCCSSDPSSLLCTLLDELSPAAMAAFDLACCHAQLWKTSRQLLDTAERRLNSSLETRGVQVDHKIPHSEEICGFPMILHQISKILNHFASNKGSVKTEAVIDEQVFSSPFGCCVQEVLLCCYQTLTEESIAARLALSQRLEATLNVLSSATEGAEGRVGSSLLALLVEQSNLKQSELDSHPVRTNMKLLLRSLDQLCPFEPDGELARPDYVRSFLDYVNTLASVLVRSLSSEDQSSEVKLGNPLLVLLQTPSQLLSLLLFDRQVSPDRVLSLLHQEHLRLSVQQVIVQRCCNSLPLWFSSSHPKMDSSQVKKDQGLFSVANLSALLQQHAQQHVSALGISENVSATQSESSSDSEASVDDQSASPALLSSSPASSSSSSSSSSNSFLLTPSALTFLKSRSPLLATLVCLTACKRETGRTQPSGWSGYFRTGRKEVVLDVEQISHEAENLLKGFPILAAYLHSTADPVLDAPSNDTDRCPAGLGSVLCGKPLVALLLSGPQEEVAQSVAAEAFQKAVSSRDLTRALRLLELYGQGCSQEGALRDQLLAYVALEGGVEGTGHLFRVKDANLRGRVALQVLERWPLGACLELLEFCLKDPDTVTSLRKDLELKKKELDIYNWMLNLQPALPWATWQELRTKSKTKSESLFSKMLEAKEFALCEEWVELCPVSEQLNLQLKTEHLLHLLEKGQTDEAFQLLEGLSDFVAGLDICERALDRCPGLSACHFLSNYLTLHFQRQMSPARRCHIHALHLGSKVLLTLPPAARQDYFPLLSEPLLMLEQLLMNLKVDWADVAVRTLRNLLVGQEAGFGAEDIDKLLTDYACKALDFSCAPKERSRSDSVISLQDTLILSPAQDSSSMSFNRFESPASSTDSTPTHTPSSSSLTERDQSSGGRKRCGPDNFQPPDQPPARKDWVPDTKQHMCMVCQRERFTMFNRRHHCRRCGRLVCHACSERKMLVDGCPGEEVRVCDQCYTYFHPDSDDELESPEVFGGPAVMETFDNLLHLPEVVHRKFQLGTNSAKNQLLRSEFYYEQAPSAYLCASILSLHSDQTACGHQLILHCRSLSRKLTNPEVDACLLTDVMKQLLFSAKLMFVKVGRNQDLALCDSYISKVDLLKILVTANYKYVPSLDDILEMPAISRLRNQLLEAEYYQLAVEVSTKSGLDPGGVWQAWAMASLKAGNLSGAREKFSRCLKPPLDRNQLNLGPSLLQDIVQHLESVVRPALTTSYGEDILASLRELEDVLNDTMGSVEKPEAATQSSDLNQECLFYLNTYGTHLALVSFYMRHDCMTEALTYLLNKECPDEVFLEGVLQPSLESGQLGSLQGILRKLDPDLETCSRYLISACQFLQRRGHFNTLYQIQQFMMDHVRAAMTCIRFFTHGATSYLQLGEQQRWLVRAKEHLRTFLQEQQGRGSGRRKTSVNSFRKIMSSSDVSRHMNTIELQLEVTRFLHRCETAASSKSAHTSAASSKSSRSNSPPTLFGGSPVKVEVACKVMLGGKNIEEGFGIAYRVIQDFQLEAQSVYTRAGQRLVRQRQYGSVRQLLKCVGESGTATKNDCDALVLSCVSVADKGPSDAKELESLILETKSTESKIKAYLLCGKLRPAYLLAVKLEPSRAGPLVQDVLQAADGAQDSVMQNICRQWLSEHHNKSTSQQQRQGRTTAR